MVSLVKDESVVIISFGANLVSTQLVDAVNKSLNQEERLFAFDMQKLKFIDSSGLGDLVSQFKKITGKGGKLVLFNLTPFVHKLVEMTKLNRILTIASDEVEAKLLLSK